MIYGLISNELGENSGRYTYSVTFICVTENASQNFNGHSLLVFVNRFEQTFPIRCSTAQLFQREISDSHIQFLIFKSFSKTLVGAPQYHFNYFFIRHP